MYNYKVERYDFGDNESYILESTDQEYLVEEILKLSAQDNGRYTYRIEKWNNDEMVGGWRFFQNGKEFTQRVRDAVEKGLSNSK